MTTDTNATTLAVGIDEAARRAGVGRGLLYQEIGKGRLRVRKAGRRTLITINDLSAWLDALPTRADKGKA
jgi:excisionase family DNA binding protein